MWYHRRLLTYKLLIDDRCSILTKGPVQSRYVLLRLYIETPSGRFDHRQMLVGTNQVHPGACDHR